MIFRKGEKVAWVHEDKIIAVGILEQKYQDKNRKNYWRFKHESGETSLVFEREMKKIKIIVKKPV
jgi:hypothetical protein